MVEGEQDLAKQDKLADEIDKVYRDKDEEFLAKS